MNYKNLLLLLFQNGGELYTKDAKATLLDSRRRWMRFLL